MYLDLLLILSRISIILYPIGGLPFILSFIDHFQFMPEECAMPDLFNDDFLKYIENVRRLI